MKIKYSILTLILSIGLCCCLGAAGDGCDNGVPQQSSDQVAKAQQETMLQEANAQCGMPNIKNFREKKLLKDIYELRDQTGLNTYTYIVAEQTGKLVFLGNSIGYGLPAATEYTNPQKIEASYTSSQAAAYATLPQADPNGLFSPASAEGTWVMMVSPIDHQARPVYIEPRVLVSPFPLQAN